MRMDKYMSAGMTFGEASVARAKDRAANAEANAAKKAKRTADAMHCQCCGRSILANTGVIAHHGYERPDYGWQTASCMGARALPFEASRDRLGDMIKFLCERLVGKKAHRKAIDDETRPCVYRYAEYDQTRNNYGNRIKEQKTFDVTAATWKEFSDVGGIGRKHGGIYGVYEFADYKAKHLVGCDREIAALAGHIKEEQVRFDGWVATHKWIGKEWKKL